MAQVVHSAFQFAYEHPGSMRKWCDESNFLVIVAVPNMHELLKLGAEARHRGIGFSMAVEPDLDMELTAIALEPGPAARKLCAQLPLALKEKVDA